MDCPRCRIPFATLTYQSSEIASCSRCGGLFLDPGTLDRIAAPHEGDLEFSTLEAESFTHDDRYPVTSCPRCPDVEMKKVEFNIHTDIILDYCEKCRSFWLDGRELERIDEEVRALDDASDGSVVPVMQWFASFIWGLPR